MMLFFCSCSIKINDYNFYKMVVKLNRRFLIQAQQNQHKNMSSVLDYYGAYNPESSMDWEGFKSSKFSRTKKHFTPRDSIRSSLQIPIYQSKSGRKHYQQSLSPQKQFRSSLRKVQIESWKPRQSSKRIVQMSLTKPHARRQKRHLSPLNLTNDKYAGLRTFYNLGLKNDMKQYKIQDKMQRKTRVNQNEFRKTHFQNQSHSMIYSEIKW